MLYEVKFNGLVLERAHDSVKVEHLLLDELAVMSNEYSKVS